VTAGTVTAGAVAAGTATAGTVPQEQWPQEQWPQEQWPEKDQRPVTTLWPVTNTVTDEKAVEGKLLIFKMFSAPPPTRSGQEDTLRN